jgi:hypothetical protein
MPLRVSFAHYHDTRTLTRSTLLTEEKQVAVPWFAPLPVVQAHCRTCTGSNAKQRHQPSASPRMQAVQLKVRPSPTNKLLCVVGLTNQPGSLISHNGSVRVYPATQHTRCQKAVTDRPTRRACRRYVCCCVEVINKATSDLAADCTRTVSHTCARKPCSPDFCAAMATHAQNDSTMRERCTQRSSNAYSTSTMREC